MVGFSVDPSNYKQHLSAKHADLLGDALLNAPVEAIQSLSADEAASLKTTFSINTVGELADSESHRSARVIAEAARAQQAQVPADAEWLFDEAVPTARPDDAEDSGERAQVFSRSVIGTDERVTVDPLGPFFEKICYLGLEAANGKHYRGTGFYINYGGRAALLTAAHCLYSRSLGGYMKKVSVIRGRSGNSWPFGVQTVRSDALRVPEEWKRSSHPEYDWGIILVDGPRWGFDCSALTDDDLQNHTMRTAGYPSDKPGYKMWYETGPVTKTTTRKIYYREDTATGQSGSPVWAKVPGQNQWNAVGIHAYGYTNSAGNSATRITADMLKQITAWTD